MKMYLGLCRIPFIRLHYMLHQYSAQYAKSLQYLFACVHVGEGRDGANNPTDFPFYPSPNGSFMYRETLIKVPSGLTWKRH